MLLFVAARSSARGARGPGHARPHTHGLLPSRSQKPAIAHFTISSTPRRSHRVPARVRIGATRRGN